MGEPATRSTNSELVLTATRRQAEMLRARDTLERLRAGERAWETPQIHAIASWCRQTWQQAWPLELLLNEAQSGLLWELVCAESVSPGADASLPPPERAALAATADRLLVRYRLAPPAPVPASPPEHRAFTGWRARYLARLTERGWIDEPRLPEAVVALIRAGAVDVPKNVRLAGFDRLTPLDAGIAEALAAAGARPSTPPALPLIVTPRDPEEELALAAAWVRARTVAEPHARIGIVVPDLPRRSAALERALTDELCPAASLKHPALRGAAPFTLEHAPPLDSYPIVRFALELLEEMQPLVSTEFFAALLRSPFVVGAEEERAARAGFAHVLLKHGRPRERIADLLDRVTAFEGDLAALRSVLAACSTRLAVDEPRIASATAHVERWRALLALWGWPGERPLDSREYQCVDAFRKLLDTFASLDLLAAERPGESERAALARLRRMARARSFAPESTLTNIHVLTPRDAVDMGFERVWLLGADEDSWPPRVRPHPLLPVDWQREHGLPGARSEETAADGARLAERIFAGASEAIASAPERSRDEMRHPSSLIAGASATPAQLGLESAAHALRLASHAGAGDATALEEVEDAPVPLAAGGVHKGGARLIADQAACPFLAFARHRLGAERVELPQEHVGERLRGSLLHRALEHFYRECTSLTSLRALGGEELRSRAHVCVRSACAELLDGCRDLGPLERRLEEERAERLLLAWLHIELEEPGRAPFEVESIEEEREHTIGGVRLHLRADRIDRLEDGRCVIIDYKTGAKASPASWTDIRIDEPQLPLYAMAHFRKTAAIAFARLRRDDVGYQGFAEAAGVLPGVEAYPPARGSQRPRPHDWPSLVKFWYAGLHGLAEEFTHGCARVDPKSRAKNCRDCHLHAFCRIADRAPAIESPGASAEEGEFDEDEEEEPA